MAIYQSMTYEKKWKPIIDEEWNAYEKQWKAENPNTSIPKNRFTFMNNFIKAKYAEETDEVKDEVRERRKAIKAEVDGVAGEQNDAYQRQLNFSLLLGNVTHVGLSAINKLPCTLKVMGDNIMKQTGWNVTFLVGGPEPRQNGKIMMFM